MRKLIAGFSIVFLTYSGVALTALAKQPLDGFEAHPPIHVRPTPGGGGPGGQTTNATPTGLSPATVRSIYNLPSSGGSGTIAIIDAFDDVNIEKDLGTFSTYFGLPACTTKNGCFQKVLMAPRIRSDQSWALETSLDTQWAHAIAPSAKILLVVAKSASGNDLLAAVDYARNRSDVVAISMSWGAGEFSGESAYDSHFVSPTGAAFFASTGDSGSGVQWPAVSNNVVAVGGTTLTLSNGQLISEIAWSGSGGGLSAYEPAPSYQTTYGVPQANGFRAVPDVSYNADPSSGVSIYDSLGYNGVTGWFTVGGTSAGAPQWAAIRALAGTAANPAIYADAANAVTYASKFRDVMSGTNGSCGFRCTAKTAYDYVTGLGSPLAINF